MKCSVALHRYRLEKLLGSLRFVASCTYTVSKVGHCLCANRMGVPLERGIE